jgi:N-acetylneuraminic acid mutarotase
MSVSNVSIGDYNHTATLLPNGKVLVVGKSGAGLYDPASGTWTNITSLPFELQTATLLPDGRVFFAGGKMTNYTGEFDPATKTWTTHKAMSCRRISSAAALLPNGRVLIIGGASKLFMGAASIYDALSSTEVYDPTTGQWAMTGEMKTGRCGLTATSLHNGRVLVVGGMTMREADDPEIAKFSPESRRNGLWKPTNRAELYDPATRQWRQTGAMSCGRFGHTATLLPDGKVLVAGGIQTPDHVCTAEIYDPKTETWSVTSPLHAARYDHTATLLPNGTVLIAGGCRIDGKSISNESGSLSSTEIYDLNEDCR